MRRRRIRAVLATLAAAAGLVALSTATPAHAVVGGNDAITNPGAVSLWTMSPYRNRCTGTLIDDGDAPGSEWVLTAAHCVYVFTDPASGGVEARIGALDNTTGGNFETRTATQFVWHPSFDPATLANDVMLIRLNEPAYSQAMKFNFPHPPVGLVGDVHGWGWTCDGPPGLACSSWYQGPLQRYATHTIPTSECATAVDVNHACFESLNGEYKSACLGDSGAGMTARVFNGRWEHVLPIMVLGDGDDWSGASCTTAPDGGNGLGLGVKLDHYQDWMRDVMGGVAAQSFAAVPDPTPRALALIG